MSSTEILDVHVDPSARRFASWPLWVSATGLVGLVALLLESRPDAREDLDHPMNAETATAVGHELFRVAGVLGYIAALMLLVLAAIWHQRVSRRFPGSTAANVVTFSAIATSALTTLAFGWRGALGDYLPGGPEEGTYDTEGLYNYYVMNDFSPYIAFVPLLGACFALAWMAFREGLVSKALGATAGGYGALLLGAVAVTGVPGLPAAVLLGMIVAGIWLAFGNSPIAR